MKRRYSWGALATLGVLSLLLLVLTYPRQDPDLSSWVERVRRPEERLLVAAEPVGHYFAAFRDDRDRLVVWVRHRCRTTSCFSKTGAVMDPKRRHEVDKRRGRSAFFYTAMTGDSLDGEGSAMPIEPSHEGSITYWMEEKDTGFQWQTEIPWEE